MWKRSASPGSPGRRRTFEPEDNVSHSMKVIEVIENDDGTAQVILEFDDSTKEFLMKTWNVSEWSDDIAQKELLAALSNYVNAKQTDPDV